MGTIQINMSRLSKRIEELGKRGKRIGKGITRVSLSEENKEGRDLVIDWMKALNLDVHIDQVGNIFGIRSGRCKDQFVMLGSHLDTVKQAGQLDGALGVLSGIELIETLNDYQIETENSIVVAVFTNEEGIRFQPDMMGSLVYAGGLSVAEAHQKKALDDGTSFLDNLKKIGYLGNQKPGFIKPKAFIEFHIEQGPVLENENLEIGIVEGVQGIYWTEYRIQGVQNHAGTTPMSMRKDAGYVAAEIIKATRDIVNQTGGTQVGTVGSVDIKPNAINVVADYTRLITDLRNINGELLNKTQNQLNEFAMKVATREGVALDIDEIVRFSPVEFNSEIVRTIESNTKKMNLSYKKMWSGAGHDAQMISRIAPTAMIFVPSKDGISHNPNEYTKPDDIEKGANVLLQVVMDLAAK